MSTMTKRRRWSLLVTVGAGLLLITLDNSILYTALPTLTEDLEASSTQGLWIINAYPLVMAGLLLGSGTLGDRIGHTRMFVVGLVIFGLASLLAALAPSPEVLIGARAVLAVGAAAMMPATLALIRTYFTVERERNFAIAIWGSLSVVGSALGPILGGTLLESFWWGSVFLVNVPVVALALVATWLIRPANDPDPSKRWDAVSSILVMIGLVGTVVAIKEIGHAPPSVATIVVALLVAAIGFWLFVRRQRRLENPLLEFSIFLNPAFSAGVLAAAFAMFAIGGIQLVTTQRFQQVVGFSPLEAGLLVAVIAVTNRDFVGLVGNARKRGHGFTLRTGAHQDNLVVRQGTHVAQVNQDAVWNLQVSQVGGNSHITNHGAAHKDYAATVGVCGIENLLHAVNVGGEGRNDNPSFTRCEDVGNDRANLALGGNEPGDLGVGGVNHEQVHSLLTQSGKRAQVGDPSVHGQLVHFEVTGVQNRSCWGGDGNGQGVWDGVVDGHKLT